MLMSRSWFPGALLTVLCLLVGGISHAQNSGAQPTILVVGDSLSAGYGVPVESTWVSLLQRKLANEGYGYRVVNASISGETTGGARARLARALQLHRPRVVIIELGGNDGLRGLPLKQMRGNLEAMIQQAKAADGKVLLIGMRMPPNYGEAYANQFYEMYGELARKHDVAVLRFLLEGVAQKPGLMQADEIHPTAAAQPQLLENVWTVLKPLLEKGP